MQQTYSDFELIIVDDNSNDNTESIVKSINDKRIKYIKHIKNFGANKARNTGILNSKGEYIAFNDSDDIWYPEKLFIQIKEIEKRGCDIVFCSFRRIEGNKIDIVPSDYIDNDNIFNNILKTNFISTQTILGKRECFFDEFFDEKLPRLQDWDLMIRLSNKYNIHFINKILLDVYVQDDSISKDNMKYLCAMRIMIDKYKDIYLNKEILNLWYISMVYLATKISDKNILMLEIIKNRSFNINIIIHYINSIIKLI